MKATQNNIQMYVECVCVLGTYELTDKMKPNNSKDCKAYKQINPPRPPLPPTCTEHRSSWELCVTKVVNMQQHEDHRHKNQLKLNVVVFRT